MANRITTVVEFVTDKATSTLNKLRADIAAADGTVGKFKAGWAGVTAAFAASPTAILAAGAAAGAVAGKSIEAASRLEESINAVNVAYGNSAKAVHRLGEQSVDSFGMSQRAFNQFAVQFSAFASQIGQASGRDPAAVLENITRRIADFASVNDLELAESARVVQSALAGETEAFRRFGGDVSAATVTQFALANGLADTASEMTEAVKIQARYGLIMEQTNKVAGDFKNTQDSLANRQRTLSANVENLAASFGSRLTPIVADAAGTINHLISVYDELVNRAGGGGESGPVGDLVSGLVSPLAAAETAMDQLNRAAVKLDEVLGGAEGNLGAFRGELDRIGLVVAEAVNPTKELVAETEAYGVTAQMTNRAIDRLAWAQIKAVDTTEAITAAQERHRGELERSLDHLHDYERAQLDVADAEDRLGEAREAQNELLREGTVSAAAKAAADQDVADAQTSAAGAAQDLLDAQADLDRVIASSAPTADDLADALGRVEDAQRDLEDATRAASRAQRDQQDAQRDLAELRTELDQLQFTQEAPVAFASPEAEKAFKEAQAREERRKRLTEQIEDAERDLEDATFKVTDTTRDLSDATVAANEAQAAHEQLLRDGINVDDQKRAALDRVADAERRLAEANAAVGQAHVARDGLLRDSIATDAEKEQAARDVERAELDLVAALEGQASAFAAQKGAVDGTTASLALQRQELERIIALNPALAAALQPAIDLQTAMGAGAVFSQLPSSVREAPSLTVNITGLVLDPVGVGRAVTDAQNAYFRAGGYGTINPRLQ